MIYPIIYAEVSVGFDRVEDLEAALPHDLYRREPLPYAAAFLAGKAFLACLACSRKPGDRRSPLPDFHIGAHAAVSGYPLLTRDAIGPTFPGWPFWSRSAGGVGRHGARFHRGHHRTLGYDVVATAPEATT